MHPTKEVRLQATQILGPPQSCTDIGELMEQALTLDMYAKKIEACNRHYAIVAQAHMWSCCALC